MNRIDAMHKVELQHNEIILIIMTMQHKFYICHGHAPRTSIAVFTYIVNHTPGGSGSALEQMFFPADCMSSITLLVEGNTDSVMNIINE